MYEYTLYYTYRKLRLMRKIIVFVFSRIFLFPRFTKFAMNFTKNIIFFFNLAPDCTVHEILYLQFCHPFNRKDFNTVYPNQLSLSLPLSVSVT